MKPTTFQLSAILTDIIATGGAMDPAATWVGIATALVDNGTATTMANVTEAVGGVATRVKITTWSAVYIRTGGVPIVDGPVCRFVASGGDTSQVIAYAFLASASTAGSLIGYAALPQTYTLAVGGAALSIVPRLTLPVQADASVLYGFEVSWDG